MSDEETFQDQTTHARVLAPQRLSAAFELVAHDGPDAGGRLVVDGTQPSRALIGKSKACDLHLADPAVSRRHASVEVVDNHIRVRDLGSTNGTTVDGLRVMDAFLDGGEIIRVGDTRIHVHRSAPVPLTAPADRMSFGITLGASPAMQRLYPLCDRLAAASVSVIIEGETGTGKEQLAESLHQMGPRRDEPFVVFDCTAVAPNLIESELFGHEKGAFTGATSRHRGVFERADGGTLLIDEIGDMPLELQAKLLRSIERLEVTRVGGSERLRVDVRVMAATRRDIEREVQQGRFRDDLYHRLAVTRIELPPLREREGDVELLARRFWAQLGGDPRALPAGIVSRWARYAWPGNIRELRNAVARRLALGDLGEIEGALQVPRSHGAQHVVAGGDIIAAVLALELPLAEARQRIVDEFEARYVRRLLDAHAGDTARAAAAAGVARRHLQRLKTKAERSDG